MKKTKRTIVRLAAMVMVSCAMVSCGKNVAADEQRVFANDVWNRFTPEVFEIDVADGEDYYNIDFSVTLDTSRYRYADLPFYIELYSPNGDNRYFYSGIAAKENGRWKGENKGGYRELSQRIKPYFVFNKKGKFRMEVYQYTSQYDLEGVHSLSVRVERTKLDYGKM